MSAANSIAFLVPRAARLLVWSGMALLGACQSIEGPSPVPAPDQAPDVAGEPFATNWRVEQHDLGNGRYAITLIKGRITIGGDGESSQIFRRRVDQIAREQGFSSYQVLEFSEGIESNMPIAQRVSRGVVQFAR